MCGISGIIGHQSPDEVIAKMTQVLKHRGPDDLGTFIDQSQGVALGHNRLSIIDLSNNGHQPMFSADGRYVIVFNGEIYNYKELKETLQSSYTFKTASDTEVLLACWLKWKEACMNKLIGMFSFAIYDTSTQQLFAARDRFGVKPFYYTYQKEVFVFASEIKALWAAGYQRMKNEKVWAGYLVNGSYGSPHETFWHQINQLPGGHYLTYHQDIGLKIQPWYHFVDATNQLLSHQEDRTETYFQLLEEAIKYRFRSDVAVGFNLSGGVDSSLLLALVNTCYPSAAIEAFTFITGNPDYDELPWVEEMIQHTSNPLNTVKLSLQDVPDLLRKVSEAEDEPFGGLPTIAYSEIFRIASAKGIKVLLDGQGMDEAWAGYDYYHSKNAQTIQGLTGSPYHPEVLDSEFLKLAAPEDYPKPYQESLLNLQYRDLFYTKIPRALRFNDRISMMYGTELREPFLDHRLVELGFCMTQDQKIQEGITKWAIRQKLNEMISEKISYAPKRPLQTPQREWLAGPLESLCHEYFKKASGTGYFKTGSLEKLYQEFKRNPVQSVHIWQYISTGLLS